ncbi:MAG: esterase/lipase family protein [Phototrophicaceae bacterium]|jgi:pimeloyl-ACP methyl ester carboxylesterase
MAGQFTWSRGHYRRGTGTLPGTQTALYRLSNLMDRGLISNREGRTFLSKGGLADFIFQITWAEDFDTPDDLLERHLEESEGFALFVHGWTGNHKIWESLPSRVVLGNRRLIALSIDHNGFGNSRLAENLPKTEDVNPPAAMRTLQRFVDLIKLRRRPGDTRPKVVNFVGHSMGGAMLFYLNPILWNYGEVTRYALAPALLLEDEAHQLFYTSLGTGINLLQRLPALEFVERAIQPRVIEILCNGASDFVKNEHSRQYKDTPRGVTGATFQAMGLLRGEDEIAHDWETFRVILGHKDNLVGLASMMDLLGKLEFPVPNLRVVPGSHYMFSVPEVVKKLDNNINPSEMMAASAGVYQHAQSRECVIMDILELHAKAFDMQKSGRVFGKA